MSKLGSITTQHGEGDIGGKAEGLAIIDRMELKEARKLRTEVFTSDFYDRYRDNGDELDGEILDHLRLVLETFPAAPISVRSSEEYENNPFIPTSGVSVSYMLPNTHESSDVRFEQLVHAVKHIYDHYALRTQEDESPGCIAVIVNPIPGVSGRTKAGEIFFPMSSGVADSFFKHPLTLEQGPQDPREGFARVAFGHGYAVVRDDFEVIPLATIKRPISPQLMSKDGQRFFYALKLDHDVRFDDREMATMANLHMRFAPPEALRYFKGKGNKINFANLVDENVLGYRDRLAEIMERIQQHEPHFQIEFTWNVLEEEGVFHVVQFKRLRDLDFTKIAVPKADKRALIVTDQVQGHGVINGIRYAIVINPFEYSEELHDEVVAEIGRLDAALKENGERYVLVCPGRLGTTNRRWGYSIDFESVSNAAAIVEYGYDIKGSPSIEPEHDELTGGIYGSHFLYQILGGAEEAEKRRRARLFGSQGTHFLTNLYTSGTLYLFVDPHQNKLSPWFFSPPPAAENRPVYLKEFERTMSAHANQLQRECVVAPSTSDFVELRGTAPLKRQSSLRVINPHKLSRVFVFAASREIRAAARQLNHQLPSCEVRVFSDPAKVHRKLTDRAFVLITDEGSMPFIDREEFKRLNPFGTLVLLSYDLRVGSAPTRQDVEGLCPAARKADLVFFVDGEDCRPTLVMPAVARYAEDLHNIEYHKSAKRFIFLVVDDELRWFSQFLPVLYRIIGQRAGVMLARTYEGAKAIIDEHGSDIVCLITDMLFPKAGIITPEAGRDLVVATKQDRPRLPIIIASKADEGTELQDLALILPKGDPDTVEILDKYVHDFTGLGDFLFFEEGELWRRASTLSELRDAVAAAPVEMLEEYAENDYFSTWLYMHGFQGLGDRLRGRRVHGDELKEVLLTSFSQALAVVEKQELIFSNESKQIVGKAKTVEDLVQIIQSIDLETLVVYTSSDLFSMWMMRKGYPALADRLRPIHGEGEELRDELVAVIEEWLEENR